MRNLTYREILLFGALICFVIAAVIDYPLPHGPDRPTRNLGNFCCSTGFVFITLALMQE